MGQLRLKYMYLTLARASIKTNHPLLPSRTHKASSHLIKQKMASRTLYIIYNADASILGKLNYGYRKLTAPKD